MSLLNFAIIIASLIQPGSEVRHISLLQAIAEEAGTPERTSELVVWAAHESRMGDALSGKRFDGLAFGPLQVRGNPALEHDERGSVRAWLRIRAAAAKVCGEELALAGLSSGRCDRGTRLAAERSAEAAWYLMVARAIATTD